MHINKWKYPIWKGYMWNYSIYMIFWKRQNCGDCSGCQWLESKGWICGTQWVYRAMKTLCVEIKHVCMFRSIEGIPPRVNPSVNHGLWVIMMCQSTFIICNKCITLSGIWTMQKCVPCVPHCCGCKICLFTVYIIAM